MRFNIPVSILLLALLSTPSLAQIVTVTPGTSYLAVSVPSAMGGGGICIINSNCVNPALGIPLSAYATATSVDSQFATVGNQFTGVNNLLATVNGQINTINSHITDLSSGLSRQTSFAAALGAMRDAIPNDGDRFAVRGSFSSVSNAVGGGFSASANIDRQFRATVSYAGSRGENVVSGGLNFSFN